MRFKTKKRIIKLRKIILQIIQIAIGTALMAVAVDLFLLPNQISSGGFSGIGTILYYLFEFPVGTTTLLLNVPLFIIALIKDGKKFFFNALIGTAFLSFFLNIFQRFGALTQDRFLACIYGGIITGIGTAIVLKANSSTGGTDLVAHIIRKIFPWIRTSMTIIFLDTIIIASNVLFFKELEIGLYSAITIYIMGKIIDLFFEGIDFAKMILIISPKNQEISRRINRQIRRGTTALYGKGMYKNEDKEILMCVVSRGEVRHIMKIIRDIDKQAFIIITNAREVYGKGFK
ncbi:MAG: YitT family protein [Clostridiales bacterium]|nr:YitT family protein [Clostridiales bacterium]